MTSSAEQTPIDPSASSGPALPPRAHAGRAATAARAAVRTLAPFLVGLVLATLVFHRVSLQRSHSFVGYGDATKQSYAWHVANATALRHGVIKLWDFDTSSGESFAGELQTAPMYPVTWIFAFLFAPQDPDAVEWLIVFHFGLLFGFGYLLFRHNRLGPLPSFFGAIILTFTGAFCHRAPAQANIFASLVYLPGVILCAQKAIEHRGRELRNPWVAVGGALVGLMVLAGHLQPLFHTITALGILLLVESWGARRFPVRSAVRLAAMGLIGAALAAPQLAATGEYLGHAYRWVTPDRFTKPPHRVPREVFGTGSVLTAEAWRTLWGPRAIPGEGITLFLTQTGLIAAAMGLTERSRRVAFAVVLVALSVLSAMGDGSVVGRLSYFVPTIGAVREASRILCLYSLGASFLAAIGLERLGALLGGARAWKAVACTGAVVLAAWEGYDAAQLLFTPRSSPSYPSNAYAVGRELALERLTRYAPDGAYRYIGAPDEVLPPNLGYVTGALSTRGYRATMERVYFDYLARDWSPTGPIFRRLGLRYVVSDHAIPGLAQVGQVGALRLLERPDHLSVFQRLSPDGGAVESAGVTDVRWYENSVALTLQPGQAGRLVFAQPWYPGWRVYVDGARRKLLRDDVFPAVDIGATDRVVEFRYRPWWLIPTSLLSIAGVLICVWLVVAGTRQGSRAAWDPS